MSKEEQTENLLSAPSLSDSVESSLTSGFFSLGDWPNQNWWEIFHSPQLTALIVEALHQNPTIQTVSSRVEFAKQTAKVVRSKLFPLVFFNAEETWEYLSHNGLDRAFNPHIPINANLVDLTLSFEYEFDFWGKNRNLFRAALGEKQAEEAESAQVKLVTAAAVAQAYFALKTNLVRKRLYEQLVTERSRFYQLQKLLQEKALLSKLEPLLSEENFLEAEKLLSAIEEEIAEDRHLINVLVGRGPDVPLEIEEGFPPLPSTLAIPNNLSIDLLARRPDLMAQIWRVESLAHEVGAAKADFYPNINLNGFAGLESVLYHLLFSSNSFTAGLQPAFHLPIFTAGAIRANVRAKKARFDEAVNEYNNLLLNSAQEVADLLALAKSIFEQKDEQEKIVRDSKERLELTLLRGRAGLDSFLSIYFIEDEWIQKELTNIELLYGQYLAAIKLMKALGGGYQSEYGLPLKAREEKP